MNQYETYSGKHQNAWIQQKLSLLAHLLWPFLRIPNIPNSFQTRFCHRCLPCIFCAKFLVSEEPKWFPPQTYHHLKRPFGQLNSGNKQQMNPTNWGGNIWCCTLYFTGAIGHLEFLQWNNYNGYLGKNDAFHWAPGFGVANFLEKVKWNPRFQPAWRLGINNLIFWFCDVLVFSGDSCETWLLNFTRTTKVMKETCRKNNQNGHEKKHCAIIQLVLTPLPWANLH